MSRHIVHLSRRRFRRSERRGDAARRLVRSVRRAPDARKHKLLHARSELPLLVHRPQNIGEQSITGDISEQAVEIHVVVTQRNHDGIHRGERELGQHARGQVIGVDKNSVKGLGQRLHGVAKHFSSADPLISRARPQRNLHLIIRRHRRRLAIPTHRAGAGDQIQVLRHFLVHVVRTNHEIRQIHIRSRFVFQLRRAPRAREPRSEHAPLPRASAVFAASRFVPFPSRLRRHLQRAHQPFRAIIRLRDVHARLQTAHGRTDPLARASAEHQSANVAVQREIDDAHFRLRPRPRGLARDLKRHERLPGPSFVVTERDGVARHGHERRRAGS